MKQLHEQVMVMSQGAPIIGYVSGLEFDADGILWVKVTKPDGKPFWAPEQEAVTMGGSN